jgi:hypothetical protein
MSRNIMDAVLGACRVRAAPWRGGHAEPTQSPPVTGAAYGHSPMGLPAVPAGYVEEEGMA